ncbi:MAG: cupredoxin family copper-binding protein [Thermoplasmata archaeon]
MERKRFESNEDPVRVLDRRLAAGEIDRAEHEALRRLVRRTPSGKRRSPGRALSTSWLTILVVLVVVSAVAVTSMALTYGPWRASPDGTTVGDGWPWGGGGMGPGMGGGPWGVGSYDVTIAGYAYGPSELTVSVGTTITWVNMDGVMHTVSFGGHEDDHAWGPDSGPLYHMGAWSYTFMEPGTYEYHCDPHPWMTGTVIVEG